MHKGHQVGIGLRSSHKEIESTSYSLYSQQLRKARRSFCAASVWQLASLKQTNEMTKVQGHQVLMEASGGKADGESKVRSHEDMQTNGDSI